MGKLSRRKWYAKVDAVWPAIIPPLTTDEATRAARKLYRFIRKRKCALPIVVTKGNRYNDIRQDRLTGNVTLYVNPESGWKQLVHHLSHDLSRLPHGSEHARLERRMTNQVIRRGWLEGKLKRTEKPATAPADKLQEKIERTHAAIARWQSKEKRAANALKKLQRRLRAIERTQARTILVTPAQLQTLALVKQQAHAPA